MQLTVRTGTVRPFGNVIESNYPPDLLLPICFLLALYVGTYHLNVGNYLDIFSAHQDRYSREVQGISRGDNTTVPRGPQGVGG